MQRPIVVRLVLFALILSACSIREQPHPTLVTTPTSIVVPTATPAVASGNTPLPLTSTPDAVAGLNPEGQPASDWKGIPIMPGAIAGAGDEDGYVFTTKATPQQIQEFYQRELVKLGWQPMATGDGNSSTMLIFTNNASATLSISIITKGDEALVLLTM
jgi:hypothetical protein